MMVYSRVQLPYFWAEGERVLVCDLPEGAFDRDSPALTWAQKTYANTRYHSVFTPTELCSDFLGGEGTRAGCALTEKRKAVHPNNSSGKT